MIVLVLILGLGAVVLLSRGPKRRGLFALLARSAVSVVAIVLLCLYLKEHPALLLWGAAALAMFGYLRFRSHRREFAKLFPRNPTSLKRRRSDDG